MEIRIMSTVCYPALASFGQTKGNAFSLEANEGRQAVVEVLLEFIIFYYFLHKQQISTIRRYIATMKFYLMMYANWGLFVLHCHGTAVFKRIDQAHGNSNIKL